MNSTSGEVTKYYNGVAMRKYIVPQTTTLTYLLSDHLGSTSLALDTSGNVLTETRYKPWGEVRYTDQNTTLPTRYTYTGQYSYMADDATDIGSAGFGLMFYNARWYDPALGRFAQADTIVPGGVQGLDRYAYVANNPLRYTDPSGHAWDECGAKYQGYRCKIHMKQVGASKARWAAEALVGESTNCRRHTEICGDGAPASGNAGSGTTSIDTSHLDFAGYTDWEEIALLFLYINGGPNAQHGVEYILDHGIHIVLVSSGPPGRGAWYDSGHVYILTNKDDETLTQDIWALQNIIHEAHHIEQGLLLAASKFGEWNAWYIGIDVAEHLGFYEYGWNQRDRAIYLSTSVKDFSQAIQDHEPAYWNALYGTPLGDDFCLGLCSLPDYPIAGLWN